MSQYNQLCLKRCHLCDPRINPNSCPNVASWSCSCVTQQAPREVGSKSSLWLTSREWTLASHHDYPKHVSYCLSPERLNLSTTLSWSPFVLRYFGHGLGTGKSSIIQTSTFSIPWVSHIYQCGHTFLGQTHRGAQLNISHLSWGTKFHLGQPHSSAR